MQGGGEGPRGLVHMAPSQLTSGPSSSFMRLVPRAGRRAGREELALGHLATGERREVEKSGCQGLVRRTGCWAAGGGVCVHVRRCTQGCSGYVHQSRGPFTLFVCR